MNVEKSEPPVVPMKPGNRTDRDPAEGRGGRSTEPLKGKAPELPGLASVCTKRQRIAKLAKEDPERAFTSLAHCIDIEWLHEAYHLTRKDGATGVDGQTADQYEANLGANLRSLLERLKSGLYRAPPVRRVHIPKGSGGATRPIGIPTFEDKVAQRAVAMVLECVYEQDFLPCSYGFRPGRGALDATTAVDRIAMACRGGTVVELDIQKFFDTLDHKQLMDFLRLRVRDGVLLRLIGKWLNAGVLEAGAVPHPETGTPQGGVISPLLANVYLHYVLDLWFQREVKPRLHGQAELVRYADDAVIVCTQASDAERILDVLPKRFGKYGLALHPDKTRLVRFERPSRNGGPEDGNGPGSFDFLGFTFYWGKSRKGNNVVRRKTAKDRLARGLKRIGDWCRRNLHADIDEQHRGLSLKLTGHYGYYGITGNFRSLQKFALQVHRTWYRWLCRRSWAGRRSWAWFAALTDRMPLPRPRIVHPCDLDAQRIRT